MYIFTLLLLCKFRDQVERNDLGSRPLFEVMQKLQPKFWFSAHMHVKFSAYVEHFGEVSLLQILKIM